MAVPPPPLALPKNGALLLLWDQTSSWVPLAVVHYSPTIGTLLPSPSGCLHTANPSPLPGTDLWSLSLSAQPLTKHLRLWYLGQWHPWSFWLSLLSLLSTAAVLFSVALRPLYLS